MGFFSTDYIPRSTLPPRVITGNTIKPDERKRTHCNKCGAPYVEGKNFCVECGEKRVVSASINMGDKKVKAKELAEYLTGWLAENPYLYDIKIDEVTLDDFDNSCESQQCRFKIFCCRQAL